MRNRLPLFNGTSIFILLSILASTFNYFVYPVLGRVLPSQEYVNATVALSLLTQIGTFMSALLAINIGLAKQESDGSATANKITDKLNSSISFIFLCLTTLLLLLSPVIMPYANTPTAYAVPLSLMMLASIPIAIVSGRLNGLKRMAQLGAVTVLSAGTQFIIAVSIALITKSGLITLIGMAASQVIALLIIYVALKRESLPPLRTLMPQRHAFSGEVRGILAYTIAASFSIMILNLLQVVDLIFIKSHFPNSAHFYADIYVISRILFFAGTIFIWPFLGKISILPSRQNITHLKRLCTIFVLMLVGIILAMQVVGERVFALIFGNDYMLQTFSSPVLMSVLYKFALLIITAAALYFVVLRSWLVIHLLVVTSLLIGIGVYVSSGVTMNTALTFIAVGALLSAIVAIALFWYENFNGNGKARNLT